MKPPAEPLVSICIPTYDRSRYLASLLESLVGQLVGFPYPYELVIADNASPDDTCAVVQSFADRLPIRYLRHETNIGGYPNWQFVMSKAIGRYIVYLSDDDSLLGDQVAATIAKMEADPEIAVVYAPWLLFDLVAQQEQGQFYRVPHDLRIARGNHGERHDHIFPEIQITRRDALPVRPAIQALLQREAALGKQKANFYRGSAEQVVKIELGLLSFLIEQHSLGKKVMAYVAAATANTLLDCCSVLKDLLPAVVDLSWHHVGKFFPGLHIPVLSVDEINADRSDFLLILPWNLRQEVMGHFACIRESGGQFMVAIPKLEIA